METKKWRKILFLDIDGVLASADFLSKSGGKFIDKEKVALLNKLKPYSVEVVISSSWGYNEDTVKELTECGLELPIIGGIEHFHKDWLCRGTEIAKWLDDTFGDYDVFTGEVYSYTDEDCEYVILDDDVDMLMCQKDNFIHVDTDEALTEKDIENVIDILERRKLKYYERICYWNTI
jgi:hypothetical protein